MKLNKSESKLILIIGVALIIMSLLIPKVTPDTVWLYSIPNVVMCGIGISMSIVAIVNYIRANHL